MFHNTLQCIDLCVVKEAAYSKACPRSIEIAQGVGLSPPFAKARCFAEIDLRSLYNCIVVLRHYL